MKIVEFKRTHINQVIEIHLCELRTGVLTYFGRTFLEKMYNSILTENWGYIAVSDDEQEVYGFIFGLQNQVSLIKCLSSDAIIFFCMSILGDWRKAKAFWLTFLNLYFSHDLKVYPFENQRIELAHFAVKTGYKSVGIGIQLIEQLEARAKLEGITSVFTRTNNCKLVNHYRTIKNAQVLIQLNLAMHNSTTVAWKI